MNQREEEAWQLEQTFLLAKISRPFFRTCLSFTPLMSLFLFFFSPSLSVDSPSPCLDFPSCLLVSSEVKARAVCMHATASTESCRRLAPSVLLCSLSSVISFFLPHIQEEKDRERTTPLLRSSFPSIFLPLAVLSLRLCRLAYASFFLSVWRHAQEREEKKKNGWCLRPERRQ